MTKTKITIIQTHIKKIPIETNKKHKAKLQCIF